MPGGWSGYELNETLSYATGVVLTLFSEKIEVGFAMFFRIRIACGEYANRTGLKKSPL